LLQCGYTEQDLVGATVTHIDDEPISTDIQNMDELMSIFQGDGKGCVGIQTEVRVTLPSKDAVLTPARPGATETNNHVTPSSSMS